MALLPEVRRAQSAPERWDPFRELDEVTDRMRRLLDETFAGAFATPPLAGLGWGGPGWTPLVDVEETDDAYIVEADLPGVKRGDVDVELVGRELTISGEIKERERKGVLRRRTRRSGRFDYRIALPDQVASDRIEATLADGVLTVRVPKAEQAQRRKIEIKA
jgi:HSP20 family protein